MEDIYFFEVNTKYISSSELKTSKFSRVRSTSGILDVLNSRDFRCQLGVMLNGGYLLF